jgi:hypothetical protein
VAGITFDVINANGKNNPTVSVRLTRRSSEGSVKSSVVPEPQD